VQKVYSLLNSEPNIHVPYLECQNPNIRTKTNNPLSGM
jgi:hypothetical protein